MSNTVPDSIEFAYGAILKVSNGKQSLMVRMVNIACVEDDQELENDQDKLDGAKGENWGLSKAQKLPDDRWVVQHGVSACRKVVVGKVALLHSICIYVEMRSNF